VRWCGCVLQAATQAVGLARGRSHFACCGRRDWTVVLGVSWVLEAMGREVGCDHSSTTSATDTINTSCFLYLDHHSYTESFYCY